MTPAAQSPEEREARAGDSTRSFASGAGSDRPAVRTTIRKFAHRDGTAALRDERQTGWPDRIATLRTTAFGRASEEPYRRRVTDWIKLVVAALVLAGLTVRAAHPTALEVDFFRLIRDLPSPLSWTFRGLFAAGTLWAVGLAVAAAVIGRRKRLARDLLLAGVAAWATAHAMAALATGHGVLQSLHAVTHVRGVSPEFPLARVAIVVAVVSTAAPYLTRPTRRAGQVLVLVALVSALSEGAGLPNDVLGGAFLGLGIAAAVHLIFGSPGGRPTSAQVMAALSELGVDATDIHLAEKQPRAATLMVGHDQEGPIRVRVIGRDEADAQLLAKLWRFVVYKDSGPTLYLSRLQEVEHSAYMTLVARDHGVHTSAVLVAGEAGPKTAVLVERSVPGPILAHLDEGAVSDELLVELWRQVGLLRDARVSHGALDTAHVVMSPDGPAIVGFGAASTRSPMYWEQDVVSLLVSTAAIVGSKRAVAGLSRGLGAEVIPPILPLLQPAAVGGPLRSVAGARGRSLKATFDELRTAGAEAAGVETPALQQLHRVSATNLLMAVGTLLGIFALLGQVSNPSKLWQALSHADGAWIAVALFLSLLTNVPYAVALMGTVPQRLPLWPTTELELSMSFTNLAVPTVGGIASQVRFLQKQGVDLASAVAAGGLLSTVGNAVVNIALFALALAFVRRSLFHLGAIPVGGLLRIVVGVVVLVGVAVAVILGVPRIRQAVVPPVRRATSTLATVLRSPRQLFLLVAGFVVVDLVYAWCLLACLQAFGASLPFWTLLAMWVGTQTVSALVPVPGGGTAVSALGLSGLMTGFGVPAATAVAAVLVNQLVVSYVPAIPGWFATRHLIGKDEL